jgi:hypothetical protein
MTNCPLVSSSEFLHDLGYLALCGECAKKFLLFRRSHQTLLHIRQENLCVYGEYAERMHACVESLQRDSWRILIIRQETKS